MFKMLFRTVIGFSFLGLAYSILHPKYEETASYWNKGGQDALKRTVGTFENLNRGRAKNVILAIGDGMSLGTLTAGRVYAGQSNWQLGEDFVTAIDKFPHVGLLKTYNVDYQTPDSAGSGTALLTGVKTKRGMLGVTAASNKRDCSAEHVETLLEKAIKEGKSTGIVTNTMIQHATPASSYAHVTDRSWISDGRIPKEKRSRKCQDISLQLFEKRKGIQVILGGGRSAMRPRSARDEENARLCGIRRDRRDLIKEWKTDLTESGYEARYVWSRKQMMDVDVNSTDYLMGLFAHQEFKYRLQRFKDVAGEPSLAEMVEKAIGILSKNPKGFFLLIEGGLIDKAHHAGLARYALQEFVEFDKAVKMSRSMTSEQDTLFVTTADHGHMFSFGGGSVRGNPVMGLAPEHTAPKYAKDRKYYTSIVYGNGPGFSAGYYSRKSVQPWDTYSKRYMPEAAIPLPYGTHSAEDVPVYASGPMAYLLNGVNEQTHVAHVIAYAACLEHNLENMRHCNSTPVKEQGKAQLPQYDVRKTIKKVDNDIP